MKIKDIITGLLTFVIPFMLIFLIKDAPAIQHKVEVKKVEAKAAQTKPEVSADTLTPKEIIILKTKEAFGEKEVAPMLEIIQAESGFNPTNQNPHSTAYGLGQLIVANQKTYGCYHTDDPSIQADCAILYVKKRYQTPSQALKFRTRMGWY